MTKASSDKKSGKQLLEWRLQGYVQESSRNGPNDGPGPFSQFVSKTEEAGNNRDQGTNVMRSTSLSTEEYDGNRRDHHSKFITEKGL